ncbi:MAG: 3-oxoacyl-[acyl-carrier-protein] reductase [Clostridia bacterium]|nr:3-oxoacyl-[acyl-carrier-protein] reductase [Clostridia bacterium]
MDLSHKVAVVTGGSRGIGEAIATKLASLNASVVINYNKNKDKAQQVLEKIISKGGEASIYKADVSSIDEVESLFDFCTKKYGSVDILINNAGLTRDALLIRMKQKDWNDVLNINLTGTYNCTKVCSRQMIKKRYGKIINVTSVVAIAGNAGQSNYAAAKSGIIGFTKSIARELASRKINVNAVAPGFIETDMTAALSDSVKKEILKDIPLKRYGMPEDVAEVVAFLASESSSYITGQIINVDGGMIM